MHDFDHPYFVYVPKDGQPELGTLYELQPTNTFPEKGLVIIPYAHKPTVKIEAQYFNETAKSEFRPNFMAQTAPKDTLVFVPSLSKAEYLKKVDSLKRHISLGDIYEINFCLEFVASNVEIEAWQLFYNLCTANKAPYQFLAKIDQDLIMCASPELFLKKTGATLITKPIKGTSKRSKEKEEDEVLRLNLHNNLKERTENVMAVDVARNDLSMLATKGSVKVNELYHIESFETVHQMVSTVSCELKPEKTFEDVIEATFPMASMTGAPKISAMNLIAETENFNRKYYSGTMGLTQCGDYELAVLIRSLFYNTASKTLSFATGGAITQLCDPEKEYEECLLKAQGMLAASNGKIVGS